MTRVGLLSDTHGWLDPRVVAFFEGCDEVWHCGDIGDLTVTGELACRFTVRAVYGNIDDWKTRTVFPKFQHFTVEGVKVMLTHIGGYPGHYEPGILPLLEAEHPQLFACGHSHIAKVKYDEKLTCLHINPGAAGRNGFHKVRTAARFSIDGSRITDLELLELER